MASPNTLRRREEAEHLRSFAMNVVHVNQGVNRAEKRRTAKNFAKMMKCGFHAAKEAMERYERNQKIERYKAALAKAEGNVVRAEELMAEEPVASGVGFAMSETPSETAPEAEFKPVETTDENKQMPGEVGTF